jgi:hypothetical protein
MVAVSSFLFSAPTVKNAEPKASQAPEKNTAALNTSESEDSAAPAAENAGKDTVKISKAAQALLDPEVQYYSQFMVAREGFDISALSIAIVNPGAEGISKGKTLSETAQAARASLNERYGAMAAQGQPFDYNSWEGADWNTNTTWVHLSTTHALSELVHNCHDGSTSVFLTVTTICEPPDHRPKHTRLI